MQLYKAEAVVSIAAVAIDVVVVGLQTLGKGEPMQAACGSWQATVARK